MILRLSVFLFCFYQKVISESDCATRVDVPNGDELPPVLSLLLTEKVVVADASHCALQCFRRNCDVAYFHALRGVCQFTADSVAAASPLRCRDYSATKTSEGIAEIDSVQRFCISCADVTKKVPGKHQMRTPSVNRYRVISIPTRPPGVHVEWHRVNADNWGAVRSPNGKIAIPSRPSEKRVYISKVPRSSPFTTMSPMSETLRLNNYTPHQRRTLSEPRGQLRIRRLGISMQRRRDKFFRKQLKPKIMSKDRYRVDGAVTRRRGSGIARRKRTAARI